MWSLMLGAAWAQVPSERAMVERPAGGQVTMGVGYVGAVDSLTRRRGGGAEVRVHLSPSLAVQVLGDMAPAGRIGDVKARFWRPMYRGAGVNDLPVAVTQLRAQAGGGLRWAPIHGALSLAHEATVGIEFALQGGVALLDTVTAPATVQFSEEAFTQRLGEGVARLTTGPYVGADTTVRFGSRLGGSVSMRVTGFRGTLPPETLDFLPWRLHGTALFQLTFTTGRAPGPR